MSDTIHTFKGEEFPAKTRKKIVDKKHFGFTSGTHSEFEKTKTCWEERAKDLDDKIAQRMWNKIKDKTYPIKGEDYIKYSYGNGTTKETKRKHKSSRNIEE